MSRSPHDLYAVLGVDRKATPEDIKKAYRARAREHHPDRNPGDAAAEARFKEVTQAYEILSDPARRLQYDRFGRVFNQGRGGSPFGPAAEGDLGEALGRVVREVFGAGFFRKANAGEDLRYTVTVSFEEAARGTEKEISYKRHDACRRCSGSGASTGTGRSLCAACGGSGEDRSGAPAGVLGRRGRCRACRGSGYVAAPPCDGCQGRGVAEGEVTLKVKVPPGVDTGQQLQVKGKGNRGRGADGTAGTGDLLVIVHVREHAFFKRNGADVLCDLPLTFAEATLGAEVAVPTLDGRTVIRIPPGTQPGAVFTLRGKGVSPVRGGRRGDLHVRTVVEVPSGLPAEHRARLEQIAAALAPDTDLRRRWRDALGSAG